jgi:hypothetical protein
MSLFNLIHKSVVIKFSDTAKDQFDPTASYVFRLTAVDAMGFLEIQNLKPGHDGAHESVAAPFWINKDFVRELREFHPETAKGVVFSGKPAKPQAKKPIDQAPAQATPKPAKPKAPAKPKPVLS